MRELVHDLRNALFIIDLGMGMLEAAREDPDRFELALAKIRKGGVDLMNSAVDELDELTSE